MTSKIIWATKTHSRTCNSETNMVRIFTNEPYKDQKGRIREATSLVFGPLLVATVLADYKYIQIGYCDDTLFIKPVKESKNAFTITRYASGKAVVKVCDATFPVLKDFVGNYYLLPCSEKGIYCITKGGKGNE